MVPNSPLWPIIYLLDPEVTKYYVDWELKLPPLSGLGFAPVSLWSLLGCELHVKSRSCSPSSFGVDVFCPAPQWGAASSLLHSVSPFLLDHLQRPLGRLVLNPGGWFCVQGSVVVLCDVQRIFKSLNLCDRICSSHGMFWERHLYSIRSFSFAYFLQILCLNFISMNHCLIFFPFHNPHTDMTRRQCEGMYMNRDWRKALFFVRLLWAEKKAQNKQITFIVFPFWDKGCFFLDSLLHSLIWSQACGPPASASWVQGVQTHVMLGLKFISPLAVLRFEPRAFYTLGKIFATTAYSQACFHNS